MKFKKAIGWFPDVGGTYFLSRMNKKIGVFLALTCGRLKGKDVKKTGIATHFLDSARLFSLEKALCEAANLTPQTIEEILNEHSEADEGEFEASKIESIFSAPSLEEIFERLQKDNSEWSKQQLKIMSSMSPSSLKVALRQLELGSTMSLKECLEMELQLNYPFFAANDCHEGVRALFEKEIKPKWNPSKIEEVTHELVESYFKSIPGREKLDIS